MPAKYDYITIAPVTPKGKWTVCVRRIGTRDRFAPVAVCNTQTAADGIVDAMNLMQGEVKKLELPAQRLLEQVRADLAMANERVRTLQDEKSKANGENRELGRTVDRITHERNIAQARLHTAEKERDRLRAEFANYRDANPEPKLVQSA